MSCRGSSGRKRRRLERLAKMCENLMENAVTLMVLAAFVGPDPVPVAIKPSYRCRLRLAFRKPTKPPAAGRLPPRRLWGAVITMGFQGPLYDITGTIIAEDQLQLNRPSLGFHCVCCCHGYRRPLLLLL